LVEGAWRRGSGGGLKTLQAGCACFETQRYALLLSMRKIFDGIKKSASP